MKSQTFGIQSEAFVAQLLEKDKFVILERNYKKFFGEIDIIAQKDDIIAFIEVKARTNPRASMFELITPAKQRKIKQTASDYIIRNNFENATYRFDVALISYNNKQESISYIPNAFC